MRREQGDFFDASRNVCRAVLMAGIVAGVLLVNAMPGSGFNHHPSKSRIAVAYLSGGGDHADGAEGGLEGRVGGKEVQAKVLPLVYIDGDVRVTSKIGEETTPGVEGMFPKSGEVAAEDAGRFSGVGDPIAGDDEGSANLLIPRGLRNDDADDEMPDDDEEFLGPKVPWGDGYVYTRSRRSSHANGSVAGVLSGGDTRGKPPASSSVVGTIERVDPSSPFHRRTSTMRGGGDERGEDELEEADDEPGPPPGELGNPAHFNRNRDPNDHRDPQLISGMGDISAEEGEPGPGPNPYGRGGAGSDNGYGPGEPGPGPRRSGHHDQFDINEYSDPFAPHWGAFGGSRTFSRFGGYEPSFGRQQMQIGFGGRMPSPFSRRPPNRFNSMGGSFFNSGMNNFMPRTSVVDAVQDLIEDQSMFYVTFQCQPKIGKYICKMQCAQRSVMMTGICEANYCTCILKQQKKLRKKMNKRFMAAMEGFETNCSIHKKARRCKKFCKALTPDKAFTGLCTGNLCRCVTYPKTPGKKKNACTKAIKKLKKLEDTALTKLGFQPRPLSASAAQQASDIADEAIKKMKSSQSMDGCTEEDIQNLKAIIANLSQGLNLIKDHDSLETKGERAAKIGKVLEATDSISTRM